MGKPLSQTHVLGSTRRSFLYLTEIRILIISENLLLQQNTAPLPPIYVRRCLETEVSQDGGKVKLSAWQDPSPRGALSKHGNYDDYPAKRKKRVRVYSRASEKNYCFTF